MPQPLGLRAPEAEHPPKRRGFGVVALSPDLDSHPFAMAPKPVSTFPSAPGAPSTPMSRTFHATGPRRQGFFNSSSHCPLLHGSDSPDALGLVLPDATR